MWQLLVTRVLQAIFTLWVVSVVVFFSARITGSPELALLPPDAMPEDRVLFRAMYGLDRPLIVQYGRWLNRVLHGDLGQGIQHKVSVLELISAAFGAAAMLLLGVAREVPMRWRHRSTANQLRQSQKRVQNDSGTEGRHFRSK